MFWVNSSGSTKRDEQVVYFSKETIKENDNHKDYIRENYLHDWAEMVFPELHYSDKCVRYGYEIINEEE